MHGSSDESKWNWMVKVDLEEKKNDLEAGREYDEHQDKNQLDILKLIIWGILSLWVSNKDLPLSK